MVKLYTNRTCPFAHRARLALSLKGVEHERVEVPLDNMPQWFKEISPNESVPLLEHDDKRIWESLIVVQYVDDAFSGPALMPSDPYLSARSRLAVEWAASNLFPAFFKILKGQTEQPAAEVLSGALTGLEKTMVGDGPFWVGAEPSLADIAIYPLFERGVALEHYRGLRLDASAKVNRWSEAMRKHPAVEKEAVEAQVYIDAFGKLVPAGAR